MFCFNCFECFYFAHVPKRVPFNKRCIKSVEKKSLKSVREKSVREPKHNFLFSLALFCFLFSVEVKPTFGMLLSLLLFQQG